MSRFLLAASAALVGAAPAALAETQVGAALTLGYADFDSDGADSNGPTYDLEADIGAGPFTFDVDIGYDRADEDGTEISSLNTEILPRYWFSPQFGVGAYFSRQSLDADLDDSVNIDSYGLEGALRGPNFEAAAFAGETELDELSSLVDAHDFGLRGRYDLNDRVSLFGSGVWSEFDADGEDVSAHSLGLGASYDFGNGLGVYGGLRSTSIDDIDADLRTASIGVTYSLEAVNRPLILSGEYADINGDTLGLDTEGERISIGATLLFGNAQSKRMPANTATGSLAKGDRNVIGGLFSGLGF